MEAIDKWGAWKGMHLAFRRILRCHPWGTLGHDPVPEPRRPSTDSSEPSS